MVIVDVVRTSLDCVMECYLRSVVGLGCLISVPAEIVLVRCNPSELTIFFLILLKMFQCMHTLSACVALQCLNFY